MSHGTCADLIGLQDTKERKDGYHGGANAFDPTSNKRCFLNGVFQSGVFRAASASARAHGTKMPENCGVFKHVLSI